VWFPDRAPVVESGADIEDREEDQWKIVRDKRIRRPQALEENGPSAQLKPIQNPW
jgi:hypothetical protein